MRPIMLVPVFALSSALGTGLAGAQPVPPGSAVIQSYPGQSYSGQPYPGQPQTIVVPSTQPAWTRPPGTPSASSLTSPPSSPMQSQGSLTNAELANLDPAMRAEIQAEAADRKQTQLEVLQTRLLNNLQARHPARRVGAIDLGQHTLQYEAMDGTVWIAQFDNQLRILN